MRRSHRELRAAECTHRTDWFRAGGLLALGIAAAFVATSCSEPEPPPPSDPELRAELGIPDDVRIHRVDLSGRGSETRVLPGRVEVRPGDVVQFVVLDHRTHLVRFLVEEIRSDGVEFLRRTRQAAPPPLVEQGARLVLSFEDAPVGTYPFHVEGSGDPIRGEILVLAPE